MIRVVLVLCLLVPISAISAVYKCKNAAGTIDYQDRPCSGAQKAAGFNSSAYNITGSDSQAVYEAGADIDARSQKRSPSAEASEFSSSDTVGGGGTTPRLILAEKCFSGVWKNRTWGCPFKRYETAQEARARVARESAAPEFGTPETRFDQYGRSYTDLNNGGPLINNQTGRPCHRAGGPNIRCE